MLVIYNKIKWKQCLNAEYEIVSKYTFEVESLFLFNQDKTANFCDWLPQQIECKNFRFPFNRLELVVSYYYRVNRLIFVDVENQSIQYRKKRAPENNTDPAMWRQRPTQRRKHKIGESKEEEGKTPKTGVQRCHIVNEWNRIDWA